MPHGQFTDGALAGQLAAEYGLKPDPWQQLVLDSWLTCRKDRTYVAGTCGLSVPRQNGKNGILEMIELFKSAIQGRKVLHTCHEVKSNRKHFLRMKYFFDNEAKFPELYALVDAVRSTNGQEAIFLKNGGSIEFIARSRGSGRGFTADDLICDEAQELEDEQLEAILPTISACPTGNPQTILTGTPNQPGAPGTVFRRTRDGAISGRDKSTCWIEWSVDEIGDVRDKRRWADANPALGIRIVEKVITDELATMSEDGFARERLGWWEGSGAKKLISVREWEALELGDDEEPPSEGKRAFGVKFTVDGSRVVVAGCIQPRDGGPSFCEIVFDEPADGSVAWLAEWLCACKGITSQVTIDGLSGTGALMKLLGERGYPRRALVQANSTSMIAASSMALNAVKEGDMLHSGQDVLNRSAEGAERRAIGKSGGWGFGGIDPVPMEAVALAYWGAVTSRRNPGRGSRLL